MNSTKKIFRINLKLNDFKKSGIEELRLLTFMQPDICEEDGEYMPVSEEHEPIFAERQRFKKGETFPGEKGWIWVGY